MDKEKMTVKDWIIHGEWFTLMAAVIGCFIFVHHEAVHVNERLDATITQMQVNQTEINKRVDIANQRSDDLHKEFYELLKEMRASRAT